MTQDTKSDTATIVTSANIREQLRATEKLIRALKQNLDHYRTQNRELIEERGDLLSTLSRMDALKEEHTEHDNELSLLKSERDGLSDALRSLEEDHQELKHRCRVLESALVAERQRRQEAQEVIAYLEEQIVQLESMVALLREHEELRRSEERLAAYRREPGGE